MYKQMKGRVIYILEKEASFERKNSLENDFAEKSIIQRAFCDQKSSARFVLS